MDLDPECDSPADDLAEFAGRACYQSFRKPNPATRKNVDYLRHIIESSHFSVLEHASATFYIEGVSRSLTHELIRHRHLSYSQLSQRFVNEEDAEFVVPPALEADEGYLRGVMENAVDSYRGLVRLLTKDGLPRKQAREAARAVLPNMTETKIVATGNHRAWREVIARRADPSADAEIQLLVKELLRQLKEIAPNTYGDMTED